MSEKKRSKRRKDEYTGPGGAETVVEKPSKDEISVAKWLRSNVPKKKTKFLSHNVECFTASKALDGLMSSKFAQGDGCLFPTRELAIQFLDTMLVHKFFHRAKKIPVTEQELRGKTKKGSDKEKEPTTTVTSSKKEQKKEREEKGTDAESSHVEGKVGSIGAGEKQPDKEKRKRKIRLDMHPEQEFVDGPEVYVWIYDPIPMHYWLIGALLVVGAIVVCMFPLWPPSLRKGVYYLSIAAAGFLVFILGLAVLRFIVFCFVWLVTGSKHHFWLFPNLTEDVGFFASFWPLYQHEYKDGTESTGKKSKKRKRDKESDVEDEGNVTLLDTNKIDNIKENETGTISDQGSGADETTKDTLRKRNVKSDEKEVGDDKKRKESATPSESESEGSQKSSTGKDFEIVDAAEVDNP